MRRFTKKPLQELLKKKHAGGIEPFSDVYFGDVNDASYQADQILRNYSTAINHFGSFNHEFTSASKQFASLIAFMFTRLERLEEQVETYDFLLGAAFGGEAERQSLIEYLQGCSEAKTLSIVELIDKVYNSQGK